MLQHPETHHAMFLAVHVAAAAAVAAPSRQQQHARVSCKQAPFRLQPIFILLLPSCLFAPAVFGFLPTNKQLLLIPSSAGTQLHLGHDNHPVLHNSFDCFHKLLF
jgi:hypothetical protein